MPQIGEIKKGKGRNYYIYSACISCGKKRWVQKRKDQPISEYCLKCGNAKKRGIRSSPQTEFKKGQVSKENHPRWKGGKTKIDGYIFVTLAPEDFFYPMCHKSKNRVAEHRLIMAKHLGRCLLPWEVIHHKNGIRDDNKLTNLMLLPTEKYHVSDSILKCHIKRLQQRIKQLEGRVTILEAENILLKGGTYHEDFAH